jgi:hypothetical protein
MGHARLFKISTFQYLSNGIGKFSIKSVLALKLSSKDSGIHRDFNSQNGSSLGSMGVHSLTLSYIPKNIKYDSRASLLARTFASPCLGREPKAKVATIKSFQATKEFHPLTL